MRFETDHAFWTDERTVRGARRQLEPITRSHGSDALASIDRKGNAARGHDEDLAIGMLMRSVDRMRAIRPTLWSKALTHQLIVQLVFQRVQ